VKKIYSLILFLLLTGAVFAQTTYLQMGTPEYQLLDRLETLGGSLSEEYSSALKPVSRKDAVAFFIKQRQQGRFPVAGVQPIGDIDYSNIERALSVSGEWSETAEGDDGAINSRKPVLKYFYQKQPDLIHVHTDNFFMVVNPVIYTQLFTENSSNNSTGYINTRGVEWRGRILNKVGFYTFLSDNQEKGLSYVRALESRNSAFPGVDYYARRQTTYDAFIARGYIDFQLLKEHINVTFGYDKNFIGDGIRSLLLSDIGAPATFLRLRSRLWKLTYENLFIELVPDYKRGLDKILPRKYTAMHQLSINATRWLNVGIFESTIFAEANHFSADYLIPVIFYRTAAQALGSKNKTALGFNFKAIALNAVQVYGQGYFNSLSLSELGKGWWGNQFGVQLGAKYFNAFTLENLDLQGELNVVRPFTYTAKDTVTNYTHYNQPLAHPYGAGFAEGILSVKYQPLRNLYLSGKAIYSVRGTDSTRGDNWGNNIFAPSATRNSDYDYSLITGRKLTGLYLNFNAAYEIRPNIFLEAGAGHLQRKYESGEAVPSSTFFYGGLRWNIQRREYDFY